MTLQDLTFPLPSQSRDPPDTPWYAVLGIVTYLDRPHSLCVNNSQQHVP